MRLSLIIESAFESSFDGLGFHYLKSGDVWLVGGFPDFGRKGGIAANVTDTRGRVRTKYIVYDMAAYATAEGDQAAKTAASEAGYVVLLRSNNAIEGLIDIVLKPSFRKRGLGSKIVRGLRAMAPDDFEILDVKNPSRGFWTKMGGLEVDAQRHDWLIPKD